MKRRETWRTVGLFACLAATLPPWALLCRGNTPSRFTAPNLPFWERAVPPPERPVIPLRCPPAAPGAVQYDSPALQSVDVDQLPLDAERTHASPRRRLTTAAVGQAGLWLETACALGRADAGLSARQDEVAARLMNAQDRDGYLAGTGRTRWSPAQVDAFSHNLRGLLAYYAVSHSPAAIYAAMEAGDLVMAEMAPGAHGRVTPDGLLLPMARLCLATGDRRYREWVTRTAAMNTTDGVGLCAAYTLTGRPEFLRAAQNVWRLNLAGGRTDPELASALWTVTGRPDYLASADSRATPWVCPLAVGALTCTRVPGGVAVNGYVPSRAHIGTVTLVQRLTTTPTGAKTAVLTVSVPRPTAFTLRLRVPPGSGAAPRALLNGAPMPTPRGIFWAITRRWQPGDTLTVPLGGSPAPTRKRQG